MKQKYFLLTILCAVLAGSAFSQTNLSGILPCSETLGMGGSPYIVTSTITVAPGCVLNVDPGVEIQMADSAYLIVKGKANFAGTAAQPIRIHALTTTWRHIFVDSTTTQKSVFNYVIIENATNGPNGNLPDLGTYQIAAISGYYAPGLEITNCTFKNDLCCIYTFRCPKLKIQNCLLDSTNLGEKILTQYGDSALIDNCELRWTSGTGDPIDFDASDNIMITNNRIYGGDADAVDLGNHLLDVCHNVNVSYNYLYNMGDKGISCGEGCTISAHHNVIAGCDIGICSKASSVVVADHNTLYKNRVGIKSYDKGDGWGPGNLTVTNSIVASSVDSTWVKDSASLLVVSYTLSDIDTIPGTGNIMGNPAFINPSTDPAVANFNLGVGSAAVNAGDPSYPNDPNGTENDMGALYSAFASVPSLAASGSLSIYPNPSSGLLHLGFADGWKQSGKLQINVLNSIGQLIYSESILPGNFSTQYDIDLGKKPAGIYYLQIVSDKTYSMNKLIID